ncbi:hypothetical protein [Enterobacter kobei]|uniref:hypothetical protein n=1 Tax=Enterobacter kobei TaxID=208224 RepID=UPI003CF89FD6
MSIEKAARTPGKTAGGEGKVTVDSITDATALGKRFLLTVDAASLLELITPPTAAWIRAQNASSRIVYTQL